MSEYIDKKALLDEICRDNCERSYDGACHNCRTTETIADFPAADVAPVVHGEWIKQKCQGDYGLCSECNCRIPWIPQNYKFCPECGARMDGEQNAAD